MIAVEKSYRFKDHIPKGRTLKLTMLNVYGMEVQNSSLEDDHKAFQSIQLERYLKRKTKQRFCSEVEKDVILQIIEDSWVEFRNRRNLSQMDTEQKIHSFYGFTLVFPYFVAEEESIISYDFQKKCKIKGEEQCYCGSALPYRQCCGSIKNIKELSKGSF